MTAENANSLTGQRTCPRCGAAFTCGMAAGEAQCWCFDLPNVIRLSSIGEAGCLCPDCLRAAIVAAAAARAAHEKRPIGR